MTIATPATALAVINSLIVTNGTQSITATVLNTALAAMNSALAQIFPNRVAV